MAPDRDPRNPDAEGGEPEADEGHDRIGPDEGLDGDLPGGHLAGDDLSGDDLPGGDLSGGEPGDDEVPEFAGEDQGGVQTGLPGKVESWRKRSATGAVLTGIALGLQQVFEKEREEPAIIQTTSGDPPKDLPVEADVEHGRPRRSVVNIRPWLLDRSGTGSAAGAAEPAEPAGGGSKGANRTEPGAAAGEEGPTGSSPEGD